MSQAANCHAAKVWIGEDQPTVRRASQLLNQRLKVITIDGRTLRGDLQCIDKQQNIILIQTVDCRRNARSGEYEERSIGQVMVPPEQRVTCELEVSMQQLQRFETLLRGG